MTKVSSDAELAQELARQGTAGLESVYRAYAAKLYTYALTMLRDPAAAQDVVHDALLVAAESIGQLRDPQKFRPWLYAITRNECLRTLRGRKRFSDSDEVVDVADTVDFDAGLRREEATRLIGQAMAAMSPADRDIVSLALQHDLDVERISEVTGTTPNTVHARLSRARTGLSDAVSALALYRSRVKCDQLQAIVSPDDQPLTPLLRKRIQRHVKSCDECQTRRKVALAAVGPAMANPTYVSPPASLRTRLLVSAGSGQAQPLALRAAPFQPDGFPVPLDARSRRRWPLVVGASGAVLILAGLVMLLLGRGDPPSTQVSTGTISASPAMPPTSLPPTPSVPATAADSALTAAPGPAATTPRTTTAPTTPPMPTQSLPTQPPAAPPTRSATPKPSKTTKPPTTTKPSKPAKAPTVSPSTPTPEDPATEVPTTEPPATEPAPSAPPEIDSTTLVNEDRADDGSFTRCDAFTLRIGASVSGPVDATEAVISPGNTTAQLSGDPLQTRVTLPPGEYSVSVRATGPGGTTTRDAGSVLHICPG